MLKYIDNYMSRLSAVGMSELVEIFKDKILWPELGFPQELRERIFTSVRTFWIFLGQVLAPSPTCVSALKKVQSWYSILFNDTISSSTAGLCKAQKRLAQRLVDEILKRVIEKQQSRISSQYLWSERQVKVVDGSSISMPDTKENQELYPQPKGQKEGCGFPVMKIVVIFSLTDGIIVDYGKSNLQNHEVNIWHKMLDSYKEGDVALGDRAYCSFALYSLLKKKKVDCVMRLHQARKEKKIVKKYNKKDYLVHWKKEMSQQPKWMSSEQWKEIPDLVTVRYVEVEADVPGFRTKTFTVATTLLDKDKYPADQIAELYRRRWLAELFFRDIKTSMGMGILRRKTPDMIHKELAIYIIAYNLIRAMIWDAVFKEGNDPYRISFKGTIATIEIWAVIIAVLNGDDEKKRVMNLLIQTIAADKIPKRKGRKREPRAIKRRTNSNYQLLTKPRHQFMEIPHRHKYRKDKHSKI